MWPLVELVRRSRSEPDCELALELHDDVRWGDEGTPRELMQLKHSIDGNKGLGDMDPDWWRTLTVWMDVAHPTDPSGPTLTLVTTRQAAHGSAASLLRPTDHRPEQALAALERAAIDSTTQTTVDARRRFLNDLSDAERRIFIGRMYVIDGATAAGPGLDEELRRELHLVLPTGHEDSFVGLVWDWWWRQALALLRRERATVSGLELRGFVDDVRDSFGEGRLPTLVSADAFDPAAVDEYRSRLFVAQLGWIAWPATLLQKAMVDYYRAYTQSALWVEDHLIGLDELETYERALRDEWEREFEFMKLTLGDDADEHAKRAAGQQLLKAISNQTRVVVRERYTEPFFNRGKLHQLADDADSDQRVGWHPDFEELVVALLSEA